MTNFEMKALLEKALGIEVDEERAAWVLAGVEAAQQSVHLTDGIQRDLQAESTTEQNPAHEQLPSPPIGR